MAKSPSVTGASNARMEGYGKPAPTSKMNSAVSTANWQGFEPSLTPKIPMMNGFAKPAKKVADAAHLASQGDDVLEVSAKVAVQEEANYSESSVAMMDVGAVQSSESAPAQSDDGDGGVSTPLIIGGVLLAGGAIALAASGGGSDKKDTTPPVAPENKAPTFTSAATADVKENEAASKVVYTAKATDPENGTITYKLGGADAAFFNIDASTGAVTLKVSADFETKASYAFEVTATDNGSPPKSATQAVKLTVLDVNEAPTFTSGTTATVSENADPNAVVYKAAVTDPDANDTAVFTLGGQDAAAFTIDAATGEVKLKSAADFETKSSYSFTVTATDKGTPSNSVTQAVTLTVLDVNEAPIFTSAATATVVENTDPNAVVYKAVVTDPDANDTAVFTISGRDADAFTIDAATGEVKLLDSANYEATTDHQYKFTVTATDKGGLTSTQDVVIAVEDQVDVYAGGLDKGLFGNSVTIDAANGGDQKNILDVNFRFDETDAQSDVRIIHFTKNDYINFLGVDPDDYNYQADGTDLVLTYLPAGGDLSKIVLVDVLKPGALVHDATSADAALDASLGDGNYFVGTTVAETINLDSNKGPYNAAGKAVTFTDDGALESYGLIQNFRGDDKILFSHVGSINDLLFSNDSNDVNDLKIDFFDTNGNLSAIVLDNVLGGALVYDFDSASLALGRTDFVTFG